MTEMKWQETKWAIYDKWKDCCEYQSQIEVEKKDEKNEQYVKWNDYCDKQSQMWYDAKNSWKSFGKWNNGSDD